jgi:hypothetical protein
VTPAATPARSRALPRLLAALLTVAAAVIVVELVRAASSGDALDVVPFAVFCLLAAGLLVAAVRLWARGRSE